MTTHAQADDFDVGKPIFDQLKDLPPERQQRILRWVAEGLGVLAAPLTLAPQSSGAAYTPELALPGQTGASGATDIKSFIGTKAPKSDQQFAAAVAYFYRFAAPPAERRDSINGDLLQEAARLARRNRLTNPRSTLNNAKAAGYLDGTSRGEFSINSVGENLVAMALLGGGDTAARQVKKKAKKPLSKAKTKTANKTKIR
jgi:hypothetical protein